MTAEIVKITNQEWQEWLFSAYESFAELLPPSQHLRLAQFFQCAGEEIDNGTFPMSRESFSLYMRDIYVAYAEANGLEVEEE